MSTTPQNPPPYPDGVPMPPKFRRYFNRLCDWLNATQPVDGTGMTLTQTPNGRVLNAAGDGGSGGGSSRIYSFQVIDASTDSTKKVRIRLGSVKSDGSIWIPTGMFFADTPPLIMNAVGTDGVVCLKVTVDANGDTTGVVIVVLGSEPTDTATDGYWLLGTYNTDGSGNFSVVSANAEDQAHIFCGTEHHFAKG